MTTAIVNSKIGREVTLRCTGAAQTLTANLTNVAVAGETVQGLSVKKIMWSGNCSISRGANSLFSFASGTAGMIDLSGNGMANKEDFTGTIVLTTNDGGFLYVLVGKQSTFSSVY